VLTEGGVGVWAVCTRCNRRGGKSLRAGWGAALTWIIVPILALALLVFAIEWAFGGK